MLRIAIVGVGWAGTRHVEALRELGRKIALDCIVDNDADFLKSQAEELGIRKTYTDYHDALADPDVDAVSICLPHNLHCPVALAAAAAKKHILCEKPMALTVEEATRMIDVAESNGVKLYVAENVPYAPMSKFLREIVRSGRYIGELTFARMVAGFQAQQYGYPGRRAWLSTLEIGGTGTWMLHGIHSMAQLRFIFGEVDTVYMQEHKAGSFQRADLEGTMSGLFTLESGVHVSVVQTCETRLSHNLGGYTIHGDQGNVRASWNAVEVFSSTQDTRQAPELLSYPEDALSDYAQEMEAFADYVAGVSVGPTTGRSERRSLAIVEAGYESAQTGRPIHLKSRFGDLG
ncbi:MAG: Gfo/Idh/MocA family oxidoreductase [Candidatus Poribacteria bacterium]|nr:Gfo/Idh/MocA family oxidoreductase [Candidatus Poribacteria bacterium]